MRRDRSITVSIVSHGHGELVPPLISDLERCEEISRVILTLNVPEPHLALKLTGRALVRNNPVPVGFGKNHNSAFRFASTPYFLVINPDVRLEGNPFPHLLDCFSSDKVALAAPSVVNARGGHEDSVRRFPTVVGLMTKAFGGGDGRLSYPFGGRPVAVPWVAGMFMFFRSADFREVGGFDEAFYLYYEDVDLCARIWKSGRSVLLCPTVRIIHDARRASRRSIRHMSWHVQSMARYFVKHSFGRGSVHRMALSAKEETAD
jgi:N-acetylglucosaminyl-diphospho-decaprenol L-rhamnosyltransferase